METLIAILPYAWLAILIICVALEAATADFVAIWFIPAALITSLAAFLGLTPIWQLLLFAIIGTGLVFATRPLSKKLRNKRESRTNVDAVIGQKCLVTEEIDNRRGLGEIKVGGLKWSARSQNDEIIAEGEEVEILEIRGVKAIVKQIEIKSKKEI